MIDKIIGRTLIPFVFISGILILIFDKKSTSWKELKTILKDTWNGKLVR